MNLFYVNPADVQLPGLTLRGQEARHASRVMRYREGDVLFATDGRGTLYKTDILLTGREHVELRVTESRFEEPAKPELTLCLGLIKKRDRLEFAVEKAVELGVNEIIIFKGGHSQKEKVRPDRLEATVLSAMKQSLRVYLPGISVASSLKECIIKCRKTDNTAVIVADETTEKSGLHRHRQKDPAIVIVGPEGGFSKEERMLFGDLDAEYYSLGSKRLRAETAAILMVDHLRR